MFPLQATDLLRARSPAGQAFAPGTATLTVRRGRFEVRDNKGALAGQIVLDSTRGLLDLGAADGTPLGCACGKLPYPIE